MINTEVVDNILDELEDLHVQREGFNVTMLDRVIYHERDMMDSVEVPVHTIYA